MGPDTCVGNLICQSYELSTLLMNVNKLITENKLPNIWWRFLITHTDHMPEIDLTIHAEFGKCVGVARKTVKFSLFYYLLFTRTQINQKQTADQNLFVQLILHNNFFPSNFAMEIHICSTRSRSLSNSRIFFVCFCFASPHWAYISPDKRNANFPAICEQSRPCSKEKQILFSSHLLMFLFTILLFRSVSLSVSHALSVFFFYVFRCSWVYCSKIKIQFIAQIMAYFCFRSVSH